MGMVNKVVPLEKLEDTCVEWAEIMMERSPLALRMIKAGLNAELDGQAGIQELAGDARCSIIRWMRLRRVARRSLRSASLASRIILSSRNFISYKQ